MGNPASNTMDCYREFLGQRLVGLLANAQIAGSGARVTMLIFEDWRGLALCENGSYWVSNREDVRRAVRHRRDELTRIEHDLRAAVVIDRLLGRMDHA